MAEIRALSLLERGVPLQILYDLEKEYNIDEPLPLSELSDRNDILIEFIKRGRQWLLEESERKEQIWERERKKEEEKEKILRLKMKLADSQRREILHYFVTHDNTKKILKKFQEDDFGLHEAIADRFRNRGASYKTKSSERLFKTLRVRATPDRKNVCLNYPYDPQPFCSQNYLLEMRDNLKNILTEFLDCLFNSKKLYKKSTYIQVQEEVLDTQIEDLIFGNIQFRFKDWLVSIFSTKYQKYIESKGYELRSIQENFKMSKDDWYRLKNFLNYKGFVRDPLRILGWFYKSEDECKEKTPKYPFDLKADIEKEMENDNVLVYIIPPRSEEYRFMRTFGT